MSVLNLSLVSISVLDGSCSWVLEVEPSDDEMCLLKWVCILLVLMSIITLLSTSFLVVIAFVRSISMFSSSVLHLSLSEFL
jgi:hypothetical protein